MFPINRVVAYVQGVLDQERQRFNAALLRSGIENMEFRPSLPYFSENLDVNMFPLFMIERNSINGRWWSQPSTGQGIYQLSIWCALHYDRPEIAQIGLGEVADELMTMMNLRHVQQDIGGDALIYFNDTMPVPSLEFGMIQYRNAGFVRGFNAQFVCMLNQSARNPVSYE